jgi:hypothetical protein
MERSVAAILAADVVGYSRLIEADEANTCSGSAATDALFPRAKQFDAARIQLHVKKTETILETPINRERPKTNW